MVIHGSIQYAALPGNRYYDRQLLKLKWIEFGCVPYFELTYNNTYLLKRTEYNELFSSQYSELADFIDEYCNEFRNINEKVYDASMTSHEYLDEDVVKVRYSNGYTIYINYSDESADVEGNMVGNMDYLIIQGVDD